MFTNFSQASLITIFQNEPQGSNPTYPTCKMTPDIEGQIGTSLRSLLDSNGLSNVKIIGYQVGFFLFIFRNWHSLIAKISTIGRTQDHIRSN